ncbi:Importin subunit alpha [Capsicum baccatum]|uniref:Importin subunit alpha n=1 Tax=Capsicum baccatum TaxID=33114 RepID=A0A2G2UZ30_CAPBA|nr:Importin subunit alpha [Capsicum baccatum]
MKNPFDIVDDFLMRSELVGEYYLAPRGKFGISPNLCAIVGLLIMILLARELNSDYENFKVVLHGKSTTLPPMGVLSLGGNMQQRVVRNSSYYNATNQMLNNSFISFKYTKVSRFTTYNFALYYMMNSPLEDSTLLESFVKGDDTYRNSRFKLIPYISEACWGLGNIIGDSPQLSMLRNATWTLSNFCRGKPQPQFEQTKAAFPTLACLIHSNDEEVLTDAYCTLSYLSDGINDKIQAVIESRVCPRLVELLLDTVITEISYVLHLSKDTEFCSSLSSENHGSIGIIEKLTRALENSSIFGYKYPHDLVT